MSKRRKVTAPTDKHVAKSDPHKSDQEHKGNSIRGDIASDSLKKVSIVSDSRHHEIHPKNIDGYFEMEKQIKKTFIEAQGVPNNHLKNSYTGEIGELGTKQTLYAQKGNARVRIHESKVGGGKNNGIDVVATKGKQTSIIESKATRTEAKFKLTKTKTQGEQMSPQWIQTKIREMWSSPKTAPTAELLSNQSFTKYISGADVNYGNQTVRIVTTPNRYKPLPHDVKVLNATNAATHGEMNAMRRLNTIGKVTSYFAITLDTAQIVGQIHHDIKKKDRSFSSTFRLVIEKGAGIAGSVVAVATLNIGTDFIGIGWSFVVGAEGYNLGQDLGSDIADTLGLPSLDDQEREQATRNGMDLIAGQVGTDFLDGVESAAGAISDGVTEGCELLNDNLPFEVCTPEPKPLSALESAEQQGINNESENSGENASYPDATAQVTPKPEIKTSINPQGFYARRMSIMQNNAADLEFDKNHQVNIKENNSFNESENTASPVKPSGFHARRLEIMKAHTQNKSTPDNPQDSYTKRDEPANSKVRSVLNDSDNASHYEAPKLRL